MDPLGPDGGPVEPAPVSGDGRDLTWWEGLEPEDRRAFLRSLGLLPDDSD